MSRWKKYKPPFDDRNRAGEKICVMCGKALDGKKRRWCGNPECFTLVALRSGDQTIMRRWLQDREKCICQICGMDCKLLERVISWVLQYGGDRSSYGSIYGEMILGELKEMGVILKITQWSNFVTWEADHIKPLAEGGEHHENNIRTLCVACHAEETRLLQGRLPTLNHKLITDNSQLQIFDVQ